MVKGRSPRGPRPPSNRTAPPGRRAAVPAPALSSRRSSAGSRRRLCLRSRRRAANTAGAHGATGGVGGRDGGARREEGKGTTAFGVRREASRGREYLRACPGAGRRGHGAAGAHDVRSARAWAAGSGRRRRPRPRAHAAILRRAALSKWPPGRAAGPRGVMLTEAAAGSLPATPGAGAGAAASRSLDTGRAGPRPART